MTTPEDRSNFHRRHLDDRSNHDSSNQSFFFLHRISPLIEPIIIIPWWFKFSSTPSTYLDSERKIQLQYCITASNTASFLHDCPLHRSKAYAIRSNFSRSRHCLHSFLKWLSAGTFISSPHSSHAPVVHSIFMLPPHSERTCSQWIVYTYIQYILSACSRSSSVQHPCVAEALCSHIRF